MKRSKGLAAAGCAGMWRFAVLLGLAMTLPGATASGSSVVEPDLLEAERAFTVTARRIDDNVIELRYAIATGYYMYRDRFRFAINGQPVVLAKKAWPAGKLKQDATFGRVITYRKSVRLLLPISSVVKGAAPAGQASLTLDATSQGCADAGVCYPPLHQTLVLPTGSSGWVNPQEATTSGFSRDRSSAGGLADRLTSGK